MLRCMGSISACGLTLAALLGVCAAQTTGPEPYAATLVTLTGQVSVLRDSAPWALNTGDRVKPSQVIVTGEDGYALFKLSDGSTFEVFPGSRVAFRDNPGNFRDLLELMLGRIKVHIQRLGGQPNYHKIRTPTAIISVRGTRFDVLVEDGYSTLVSVEEGQVAVEHALLPRGQPRLLNPGEWLRIFKDQPLAHGQLDKGSAVQAALRAMADAIYTTIYRGPRGGTGVPAPPGGGGGTTLPGDRGPDTPEPKAPAPAGDAGPGAPPPPPPPAGPGN